ncbi:MAG TPA: hypothetical protein VJ765_04905 [Chitinophagaceae bacterium]|nr:hypothetical protein [Chitinophagaceae bacterium]
MRKGQPLYNLCQRISAVMMIVALAWLTISAPFVLEQHQKMAKEHISSSAQLPINDTDEESNPLSNATEEKAPNSLNTFSEEYLHDNHRSEYFFSLISQFSKGENAGIYIAFHGELLVPPPNKA